MTNSPAWLRFAALHSTVFDHPPGEGGVDTVGIGGFRCSDCDRPHITLALITAAGKEVNVMVAPDTATAIVSGMVEKLGEIGSHYIALKAMRALTMVSEIATMTDIEADFLDGPGLREACRLMLNGGKMVVGAILPRRYGEEDVERALDAMDRESASSAPDYRRRMVHAVAQALGMTPAGA